MAVLSQLFEVWLSIHLLESRDDRNLTKGVELSSCQFIEVLSLGFSMQLKEMLNQPHRPAFHMIDSLRGACSQLKFKNAA